MIKIKDNIDLKKLKEFGFERLLINAHRGWEWIYTVDDSWELICISEKYRTIYMDNTRPTFGAIVEDTLGIIYDLIQAGLVEKVPNEED